jgi:hypothetical protein
LDKLAATTGESLATCSATTAGSSGTEKEWDGVVDCFEIPAQSGREAIISAKGFKEVEKKGRRTDNLALQAQY